MDPNDPLDAQQIVIDYARVLESDLEAHRHPARLDALPFAKPLIKAAIRTSVIELSHSGQLTEELRDYFETAYTLLAEYLDPELVDLITHYRESADALTVTPSAQGRMQTPAWRTLTETSALAGRLAHRTTEEAEALRREFRSFLAPA